MQLSSFNVRNVFWAPSTMSLHGMFFYVKHLSKPDSAGSALSTHTCQYVGHTSIYHLKSIDRKSQWPIQKCKFNRNESCTWNDLSSSCPQYDKEIIETISGQNVRPNSAIVVPNLGGGIKGREKERVACTNPPNWSNGVLAQNHQCSRV